MKTRALVTTALLVSASLIFGGCSLAVWVRVFNAADRTITLRSASDGKGIAIPPGGSGHVNWGSITRGRDHGFVVEDSGIERFYIVLRDAEDGVYVHAASLPLPKESRKS